MAHSRTAIPLALAALFGACSVSAPAQTTHPPTRPALANLDQDARALFIQTQRHIVRAQVPVRLNTTHPLIKWRMPLDPKLRELVDSAHSTDGPRRLSIGPATTQSTDSQSPPPSDSTPPSPPTVVVNVECVGIVLNDQGDVLLPLFIDKSYVPQVQVAVDDRVVTRARVSAADAKTALTVIRMDNPAGVPARFATDRPENGSFMLMLAQTRRTARLGIWTGESPENAILVNASGEFAGIVRNGHAIYPTAFGPVVEQLLTDGVVRRARLGVEIADVSRADPQRAEIAALGARSAVLVRAILPDSAAARGGIQPGDMILSLAGEPVGDVATFAAAIANRRGRTELLVLRDALERRVVVDLQPE